MQRIAQDWLVLSLTDSAFAVGVTTALQMGPMLVFGLWGGAIADTYNRRNVLIYTQSAMGMLAAIIAVLTLTGSIHVSQVYAVAFLLGMVTVVDTPTRQAFASEMVGPDKLKSAIGLNSANFQLGRVIGPALAGVLIVGIGVGWAFAVNALSFAAVLLGLLLMRTSELHRPEVKPGRRQIREGLRYISSKPELKWPIVLIAFIGTFAMNGAIFLSVMAKDVFAGGASQYGLFVTVMAIGSLVGALLAARFSTVKLAALIWLVVAVSLVEMVAAFAPTVGVFFVGLAIFGLVIVAFNISANTTVQMNSEPAMRGRVMSVFVIAFFGGTPIGGPFIGWMTAEYGARIGMAMCGLIPLLAAATIGLGLAVHGRTHSEESDPIAA